MLFTVAQILKDVQTTVPDQVDLSDLEKEFGLTEEEIMREPYADGKLQRAFEKSNADKLVLIDKTGQLWSVFKEDLPAGTSAFISPIELKYVIGNYIPYASLTEAEQALPAGWEVHTELTGKI